jgi:hypothetical protein
MSTVAGVLLATELVLGGFGCAKTDWIDRTLVTVDVTGTWSVVEGAVGRMTSFELEQQGSTVKGSISADPSGASGADGATPTSLLGPISGTVAGDVFRFRSTRGDVEGELTVSGDEMTGTMSRGGGGHGQGGARPISLRRVDSSSLPPSPPR